MIARHPSFDLICVQLHGHVSMYTCVEHFTHERNECDHKHDITLQRLQAENDTFQSVRRNLHNQIQASDLAAKTSLTLKTSSFQVIFVVQELKGNIRVFVRVRPPSQTSAEVC